ncbi:conserved hypothetical protein [Deferribacter desulfuricans SSM1]|uniref:Nucleotide modification associated domain-containing protein n=1 Tax=Deferribacter desulfuricans (strain DSM 14783 / JCM 11476 / NBRC 101012 / SSM1) TaxID=639282 RepID=D3PCN6_DEFDS|nr:hypothetical protein [Deferribacter desulfuricans]BAI80359.1 conserved hypothetical protein [Deferribacter desulfuricans SSM1]
MKIIFSRKGFDSSYGGFPSLIFPDGTLFSIPIPDKESNISYSDLTFKYNTFSIQDILNDVTKNKIKSGKWYNCNYKEKKFKCHFDPMYLPDKQIMAFGQTNSAASHLINHDVTKGDIFLFFGWFKHIELRNNKWCYKRKSLDIHLIWSYMIVDEIYDLNDSKQTELIKDKYPYLVSHPHISSKKYRKNILFISKNFKLLSFSDQIILTDLKNYKNRSKWRLPNYFNYPKHFTYINEKNCKIDGCDVIVNIPDRGQEFIFDINKIPQEEVKKIMSFINSL